MLTLKQKETAESTQLSTNFTLYELIRSDNHPELVEYPSNEIIDKLKDFAQKVLQPIRDKWGRIRVNSGYRNPALNKEVGGVKDSIHQIFYEDEYIGVASDLDPLDSDLEDAFNWAADNVEGIKTIIIYRKPSVISNPFMHIDNRINREKVGKMEKTAPGTYEYI